MNQSVKFWNRIAERYSKRPVTDEASYPKKLEVTREYFRPDMEVLEFGCGTGSTAIVHAPYVRHIRAVDISSAMIEIAKRKADAEGITNIAFEVSSFEELIVPDDSLDAVLALSVLHLLEDTEAVIAKVHRMLKPGGLFVSSTMCLGDSAWKYLKWITPISSRLGLMPMVEVFTLQELKDSVAGAGFRIDYEWQPGEGKALFMVANKKGIEER